MAIPDDPQATIDIQLVRIAHKLISHWTPGEEGVTPDIKVPELFRLEGTYIRLLLVDDYPFYSSPLWAVRFDGLHWRAWVRPVVFDPNYHISILNQLPDLSSRYPSIREYEDFHGQWTVEFSGGFGRADKDRAIKEATDWLLSHGHDAEHRFIEHSNTRVSRALRSFFRS